MHSPSENVSAADFYDRIAPGYDRMVGFGPRLDAACQFVATLIGRFGASQPTTGVDLGCGTGAYTLALARHGLVATGVDLSADMLQKARRNAASHNLAATFVQASLTELPPALPWGKADLVLCLGNTLPHLTEPADLAQALSAFECLLAPKGIAVIQTLNYDAILSQRERIVSVDRDGDREFIRFYDFLESGLIRFNILEIDWGGSAAITEPLNSVLLNPYCSADLEREAIAAGLSTRWFAGNLRLEPYDPESADTTILVVSR